MSIVSDAGLKYGSFKGFEYVYGVNITNTFDEVVQAFPERLQNGSKVLIFEDSKIGKVYVVSKDGSDTVPNEILMHIRDEFFTHCYEWLEFNNARDFAKYMFLDNRDRRIKLYIDKVNRRYYARRNRPDISNIVEFAVETDVPTTLDLERDETLTEVKF